MKNFLLKLSAILFLNSLAWSFDPRTLEQSDVYLIYQSTTNDLDYTSINWSTNIPYGTWLWWSVEPVGENATFEIRHATGPTASFKTNISSAVTVRSIMTDDVRGIVRNGNLRVTDVIGATTVYVRIGYLYPAYEP